jgi:hypothetical protein
LRATFIAAERARAGAFFIAVRALLAIDLTRVAMPALRAEDFFAVDLPRDDLLLVDFFTVDFFAVDFFPLERLADVDDFDLPDFFALLLPLLADFFAIEKASFG